MSKSDTDLLAYYVREMHLRQSPERVWGVDWDCPREIIGGAICSSSAHDYLYDVQASTYKGPWDSHAIPKCRVRVDELREFLEDLERCRRIPSRRLMGRSPIITVPMPDTSCDEPSTTSSGTEPSTVNEEELTDDWRSSSTQILARLLDQSIQAGELFDAILFAETVAFNENDTKRLLPRLFAFVNDHRFSQDIDTQIVVGAAIRKLAMNVPDSQIEEYADLFLPTETDALPCEVELELCKAVVWRLTDRPASLASQFPRLEGCLSELASDYLRPRLILQKNYASVAIHATLGVLLLNGRHANSALQCILNLRIDWFRDLFQRRFQRLLGKLAERGDTASNEASVRLRTFESALDAS